MGLIQKVRVLLDALVRTSVISRRIHIKDFPTFDSMKFPESIFTTLQENTSTAYVGSPAKKKRKSSKKSVGDGPFRNLKAKKSKTLKTSSSSRTLEPVKEVEAKASTLEGLLKHF